MKRLAGILVLCGFLGASLAPAKAIHPKVHRSKAAKVQRKLQAKKVKQQQAKVRRAAKAHAKTRNRKSV